MPKLTVEFNDKMNDILEQLAEEKGTTKVDVLRRAIALYKYLDGEQKDGSRVSITRDNTIVKDIVLP
jgi:predicted transcriptional regulator